MKVIIATNNQGKVKEIKEILNIEEALSLKDIRLNKEIEEDKETFEENAIKKAKEIFEEIKIPCIADDSGIEIEEYNGWPGVKTARFLGEEKAENEYARQRNEYILNKMKELPKEKRKVKYITCIAYCDEKGIKTAVGELQGYISIMPKGENGFGFDEIFELENGKTLAQLNNDEKNKISSRRKAIEEIKKLI